MNIWKFSVYTVIGAAMWNAFLTWTGVKWGQAGWDLLLNYGHTIDLIVLGLLGLAGVWFFWKHYRKVKSKV
jgi:membrane protein DedA with SNARE-associated domain